MKYRSLIFILFIAGCINYKPVDVPKPVETIWVDADTKTDTVITNVDNDPGILYYALKSWQLLSLDPNITHGYRYIAGSQADTVVVYQMNNTASAHAFICGNSINSDTLKSQNFLDTLAVNPVRMYVRLK